MQEQLEELYAKLEGTNYEGVPTHVLLHGQCLCRIIEILKRTNERIDELEQKLKGFRSYFSEIAEAHNLY